MQEICEVFVQLNCPLCFGARLIPVKSERSEFSTHQSPLVKKYDKFWAHLLECKDCGFAFCQEIPSAENFFSERYDLRFNPEVESSSEFKNKILSDLFDLLATYGKKSGRLLDIGSFAGKLMRYSQQRGFEAYGVEANRTMADFTIEKLGLNVFNGTIQQYPAKENYFDVITLIDVLEHLYRPRDIIQKSSSMLNPGGFLVIKVPNYRWQKAKQWVANTLGVSKVGIFANFGHINQFSPRALDHVMKAMGFTPKICYVSPSEMWPDTSIKNKIKNIFRTAVYCFFETFRKVTGINLGLNITYIAQKNGKS